MLSMLVTLAIQHVLTQRCRKNYDEKMSCIKWEYIDQLWANHSMTPKLGNGKSPSQSSPKWLSPRPAPSADLTGSLVESLSDNTRDMCSKHSFNCKKGLHLCIHFNVKDRSPGIPSWAFEKLPGSTGTSKWLQQIGSLNRGQAKFKWPCRRSVTCIYILHTTYIKYW